MLNVTDSLINYDFISSFEAFFKHVSTGSLKRYNGAIVFAKLNMTSDCNFLILEEKFIEIS